MISFTIVDSVLLPCLMLITSTLSSTLALPSQHNACPTDCSCVSPTITCNNTIPDGVPDDIVEVVLVNPDESVLTPRRFCNVTWPNVRMLFIKFQIDVFSIISLPEYVFECLGQIQTLKMTQLWIMPYTAEIFHGLSNVTTLDLSQSSLFANEYTMLFSVRSHLPKLNHLSLSRNQLPLYVDQDFIDSLSSRPLELLDLSKIHELTFDFENSRELCKTLNTLILHDSSMIVTTLPPMCDALQCVDLSGNQELTQVLKQCVDKYRTLPIDDFLLARVMRMDRLMTDPRGYDISNCHVNLERLLYVVRELYFTFNFLPEFEILFYIRALEYLNLSHNNIKTINPKAFGYLESLQQIDLSFNNLNEMRDFKDTFKALFRSNNKLASIDLSFNGLSYLPDETFLSNSILTEIHSNHNAFRQLSLNVSYLHKLALLDLRFNKIEYLDSQSRLAVELLYKTHKRGQQLGQRKNTTLQILLEGNPFTCSCEALEFLQWFVASPIFNASYTCDLDGRKIPMTEQAAHEAYEDCERPRRRRRTIALSTVLPGIAIVAIVTVVTILYRRHKRRLEQQRFEDTLQLIREEHTGYPYTVFLSYCGSDSEFVAEHIRQPMERHLRLLTDSDKEHVCDGELHFIPGHSIFEEMERCIAESAVFVAVVSEKFYKSYFCSVELSEAEKTGKPIILLFKGHVKEEAMGVVIKEMFMNKVRAKIVHEEGGYQMYPGWERLCKAIVGLMKIHD